MSEDILWNGFGGVGSNASRYLFYLKEHKNSDILHTTRKNNLQINIKPQKKKRKKNKQTVTEMLTPLQYLISNYITEQY